MRIEFESARALAWRAAQKLVDGGDASSWAAMAKIKTTETAVEYAETGVRLHGGRGILHDCRVARVYRDARHPIIYEGVNAIQRTSSTGTSRASWGCLPLS